MKQISKGFNERIEWKKYYEELNLIQFQNWNFDKL